MIPFIAADRAFRSVRSVIVSAESSSRVSEQGRPLVCTIIIPTSISVILVAVIL